MTKIEFLIKALENNGGSLSFFEDCSLCPLREMCGKHEEQNPGEMTCAQFIDSMTE